MALLEFRVNGVDGILCRVDECYRERLAKLLGVDLTASNSGQLEVDPLLGQLARARGLDFTGARAYGFQLDQLKSYIHDLGKVAAAASETPDRKIQWTVKS